MLNKVEKYISRYRLLDKGNRYLVALSGGADSVALIVALQQLRYRVEAAHCNFHLRGDESDRDEKFVKELCLQREIPLHLAHFDTREYAELHKISIEMAARELRYRWFEQLRKDIGALGICVGHHRDDNVETVLMNLVKGTGLHGLVGIKPRNGFILRPFLCVGRDEIDQFLKENNQQYVTDSTNLIDDVMRNKLRLRVLPLLKEINPSVCSSIQHTAERIGEAALVFDDAIEAAKKQIMVDNRIYLPALKEAVSPEYLLFEILKDFGFSSPQVEQIAARLDADSGTMYHSTSHSLLFDRGYLIIAPKQNELPVMRIPEEGTYIYNDVYRICIRKIPNMEGFTIQRAKNVLSIDEAKVAFPLTLRVAQKGDRFVPFGMEGSKLVSDFLTDIKMSLFDKQRQLVLQDANGKIIWVVNQRSDNRCRIDGATTKAITISFE